jgi:hypothetical protein
MMLADSVHADELRQQVADPASQAAIRRRSMKRELALKIVLAVVGLLFIALGYPMVVFIRQDPALSMQFSLYVTLGIFLLLAIRDPSASRSVIAFTAWCEFRSCRAHGHPGVSQHGRTWRTDRGGCSCDHRRRLNRARAIEAASGVTVTTEPTPFILTNSRLLVHMVSNACSASEVTSLGSRLYIHMK